MKVVIAGARPELWNSLAPDFAKQGLAVLPACSRQEALELLRTGSPALFLVDAHEEEKDWPVEEIQDLLIRAVQIDASVPAAVACNMPAREFEDALEGLGVLTQLPALPQEADIRALGDALAKVRRMMAAVAPGL